MSDLVEIILALLRLPLTDFMVGALPILITTLLRISPHRFIPSSWQSRFRFVGISKLAKIDLNIRIILFELSILSVVVILGFIFSLISYYFFIGIIFAIVFSYMTYWIFVNKRGTETY